MKFGEVIEALMAGGNNAIRRPWMTKGSFIRYSEYLNAPVLLYISTASRMRSFFCSVVNALAIECLRFLCNPISKCNVPGDGISQIPECLDAVCVLSAFVWHPLDVLEDITCCKVQPPVVYNAEGLNLRCPVMPGQTSTT